MRDKERIPQVLKEIQNIWEQSPDLRLGQLIINVINDPAAYYIEDDALIKTLKEFYGVE